jgi:hypothetical protein
VAMSAGAAVGVGVGGSAVGGSVGERVGGGTIVGAAVGCGAQPEKARLPSKIAVNRILITPLDRCNWVDEKPVIEPPCQILRAHLLIMKVEVKDVPRVFFHGF